MRSLCALLALSSGLAEPSFIVRFHEYRPLGEHVASLASLLGRPRAPRRAADPRAALRDLSAWASETEPEVALRTAAPRAHVPRLAPLPLARRGRLQLRLLARGAISNLKLEAQPTPTALLADSEIELQARPPARPRHV